MCTTSPTGKFVTFMKLLHRWSNCTSHKIRILQLIFKATMVQTSAAFKNWLKSSANMKLSSDAAVNRILHEGITNFGSLSDFDKKSIQYLPGICKNSIPQVAADRANNVAAEGAVNGANISSISVRRLITAVHAAEYYNSIDREMNPQNMHYENVLSNFKIEWESYSSLRTEDEPKVPKVNDKDHDRRIIRWSPIFTDCMASTYGARGPLSYVLRTASNVPAEVDDPLNASSYFGASGCLLDELEARLPHVGPIYKNDNATVYMKIEEAVRGTSVETTIKSFSRRKDGRGAFLALIANHAGETKYRSISKKRFNLLQNIKWNGRAYPLESHVSNHRQAHDDLNECSKHIQCAVPGPEQRVEYLIDSITCVDNTLQAAIGLVRANTNNMRSEFELAASSLIEVDPYRKSSRHASRTANVSSIDFGAGRGSTGVDLRWHSREAFIKLPKEHKDELSEWLRTDEGKKVKKEALSNKSNRDRKGNKRTGDDNSGGNWKKKFKKALKNDKGLKSIMSMMATEETNNQAFISALAASQLPPAPAAAAPPAPPAVAQDGAVISSVTNAFPATNLKLQSILKKKK